jgi:hypothetical protein
VFQILSNPWDTCPTKPSEIIMNTRIHHWALSLAVLAAFIGGATGIIEGWVAVTYMGLIACALALVVIAEG